MADVETDRNLLFAVLALQADVISTGQFVDACSAWAARKPGSLADLLAERGWIDAEERATVEHLLRLRLRHSGGDVGASLAAAIDGSTRSALAMVDDRDVQRTLTASPAADESVVGSTIVWEAGSRERYTLIRLHAQGGLGRVWLARDADLDRDVALKELRPERADQAAIRGRFIDEAQITGRLEHPNIVPVHELVRPGDGRRPFYTMRLVRGRTLAEAIRDYHRRLGSGEAGPLEFPALLDAFLGVCHAAAFAHDRGVIHRDLKGRNVVLGDYGEVIVLDWGLAKIAGRPEAAGGAEPDAGPDPDRGATLPGQVLGTPAYMAPEQALGRHELVGPRSDIYGLGALLFEILAGVPPFSGDTAEVLHRVIHDPPPRPRSLRSDAPAALEAVCLKALAKRPEDRYAGAADLAAEVRRYLADEPVSAYSEPASARLARWGRKHRATVAAAALSLLTAVAFLAVLVAAIGREQARTESARRLAEANYRDARRAVGDLLTDVSQEALLDEPGMQRLRRRLLEAAAGYHRAFLARQSGDPGRKVDLAESQFHLAWVTGETGRQADALPGLRRALELYREVDREHPGDPAVERALARCHRSLAMFLSRIGRRREAQGECDEAIARLEALVAGRPGDVPARSALAKAVAVEGELAHNDGRYRAAVPLYERAIGLYERVVAGPGGPARDGVELAQVYANCADVLSYLRRTPEAMARCRDALGTYERLCRDDPRSLTFRHARAHALGTLGLLHHRVGEDREAYGAFGRARTILADLVRENPAVTSYRRDLAIAEYHRADIELVALGEPERGRATLRRAADEFRALGRLDEQDTRTLQFDGVATDRLGQFAMEAGRQAEAEALFRRACALSEEAARRDPDDIIKRGDVGVSYANHAETLHGLGRLDEAATAYRKAIAAIRAAFGAAAGGHWAEPTVKWTLALEQVLRERGRSAEADAVLSRLRAEFGGDPATWYGVARDLSRSLTPSGRAPAGVAAVEGRFADRALEALREAVRAGLADRGRIDRDPDLAPLRSRPEFRATRLDLAFPPRPFAP